MGRAQGKRNSQPYVRHKDYAKIHTLAYGYIHAAVDDHTRLAYVEVLEDEKAVTATEFTQRAIEWFADHGISVQAVMTDNGACYRSHLYRDSLEANKVTHVRIPPRPPPTQWQG